MLSHLVLIVLASFSLGPLIIMLLNSLKTRSEMARNPVGLPTIPHFENYLNAWNQGGLGHALLNTSIIVGLTVGGVCIIAGLAAYALARVKVPGWELLTLYFLACTTIPVQLFIIPLFFLFERIGLTNSIFGLVVIYWAIYTPFSIFLLRSYFLGIPQDFEDAARVDGASDWQIFWLIMAPLAMPAFFTVILVVGMWSWNEFILAVTFLHNEALQTATIRFFTFSGRYTAEWGLMMAGATILAAPIVSIFLLLQRRFIEGMTAGGLKI
ncbi:MAG: carbohydrate ABC transporter permease [Firmicutes bacterium]|nr:carbohydrate ABC transporter permease [Bacillota bacterium]